MKKGVLTHRSTEPRTWQNNNIIYKLSIVNFLTLGKSHLRVYFQTKDLYR